MLSILYLREQLCWDLYTVKVNGIYHFEPYDCRSNVVGHSDKSARISTARYGTVPGISVRCSEVLGQRRAGSRYTAKQLYHQQIPPRNTCPIVAYWYTVSYGPPWTTGKGRKTGLLYEAMAVVLTAKNYLDQSPAFQMS